MDASKTGYRPPESANELVELAMKKRPHHLTKTKKWKNNENEYEQSTSIIGELCDLVDQAESVLKEQKPTEEVENSYNMNPNLDFSMTTITEDNNYLLHENLKYWENNVIESCRLPVWSKHNSDYRCEMRKIANVNPADKTQQIKQLKRRYVDYFDKAAKELYEFSKTDKYKSEQAECHFTSPNLCRLYLASLVYFVTYARVKYRSENSDNSAKNNSSKHTDTFCWQICPVELHSLKRKSELRIKNENINGDIPSFEWKCIRQS